MPKTSSPKPNSPMLCYHNKNINTDRPLSLYINSDENDFLKETFIRPFLHFHKYYFHVYHSSFRGSPAHKRPKLLIIMIMVMITTVLLLPLSVDILNAQQYSTQYEGILGSFFVCKKCSAQSVLTCNKMFPSYASIFPLWYYRFT